MISILCPITSRGCSSLLTEQPLINALLPSLSGVECELLLGYDANDSIWRRAQWRRRASFPGLRWVKLPPMGQNITAIWNRLASAARGDYLFPANDDLILESNPADAIPILKARNNFGLVAFNDSAFPELPTFFLIHRLHLSIFGGVFYPLPWKGAHQDSWIADVYRPWGASEIEPSLLCRNHVGVGSRFEYGGLEGYSEAVMHGRKTVNEWLRSHPIAPVLSNSSLEEALTVV